MRERRRRDEKLTLLEDLCDGRKREREGGRKVSDQRATTRTRRRWRLREGDQRTNETDLVGSFESKVGILADDLSFFVLGDDLQKTKR